jgi:hypothetical protein
MEKWPESLKKAKQHFDIADHMAYVSFVILKENRLMIKIINEMYSSVICLIKAMLDYEFENKRIRIYHDSALNFKTFRERVGNMYLAKKEMELILIIINLEKQHKQSEMEFVKNEKFVIMNGERYETLTIEKIKGLLSILRGIMNKVSGMLK